MKNCLKVLAAVTLLFATSVFADTLTPLQPYPTPLDPRCTLCDIHSAPEVKKEKHTKPYPANGNGVEILWYYMTFADGEDLVQGPFDSEQACEDERSKSDDVDDSCFYTSHIIDPNNR